MRRYFLLLLVSWACSPSQTQAQLFSEDFGTAFGNISTVNWPTACRNGASSFNTSVGNCAAAGDYAYSLSGFGNYITSSAISIPGAGYSLDFEFAFNNTFNFPAVEVRSVGPCGTSLLATETLSNTSGACQSHSVDLNAYAGQTIYLRFRSNTSSATTYFDAIVVDVGGGGGGPTCLLDEDFGTAFTGLNATTWPSACRSGASGFNTSSGPCSGASDYSYSMNGFVYTTSMALAIPSTGFTLDFNFAFNQTFSFPSIEFRSGTSCGTSLINTETLFNTSGACTAHSVNLDSYAGQTIYIRFRSNSSGATVYFDDIKVCGSGGAVAGIKWADNFNDNDLVLDYLGNDGNEDCPSCGPWVLGGGAGLTLVPAGGWNGNTNRTEAFPANMPNVYYARLDRNEWVESPVMDLSNHESFKISFYAKSSSPGTGGGDTWSFSDRLRLQIWDGSAWQSVHSLRDDLSAAFSGPDDYISAALPFNYYCFTAYKSTTSPGNYYFNSAPNVNSAWFHSGFKFRVIFEGGFSGAPFAWVDDFTFRADADGYSTMIPCGLSFWNQPAAMSYGQDPGTTGNNNAEKGVELELDNMINIPPLWATEADDGDTITQVFGSGESERVVFCVLSEQEINFAFPKVHFYAPDDGWNSSVMAIDNAYSGPGWKYYAVEYVSCDLTGSTIAEPTNDYRYYYSFEYGIEFLPVFYHLNTSGIEVGGGATSTLEVFNAPDVVSTDQCGSLPVEWLYFRGNWAGEDVFLEWETTQEVQNAGFELERSADGIAFHRIAGIAATAESGSGASYVFRDREAARLGAKKLWYRLKQIDLNGAFSYSETVMLDLRNRPTGLEVAAAPNPSAGTTELQLYLPEAGWMEMILLDLRGRVLLQERLKLESGKTRMPLDLESLSPGTYLLKIRAGNTRKALRVMRY